MCRISIFNVDRDSHFSINMVIHLIMNMRLPKHGTLDKLNTNCDTSICIETHTNILMSLELQ